MEVELHPSSLSLSLSLSPFSLSSCSFRGVPEFLQLVRSRVLMEQGQRATSSAGSSTRLMSIAAESSCSHKSMSYSLAELQEDIVANYVAGKPIIRDVEGIRTVFKFREEDHNIHRSCLSE